jgi:hypothetical protein
MPAFDRLQTHHEALPTLLAHPIYADEVGGIETLLPQQTQDTAGAHLPASGLSKGSHVDSMTNHADYIETTAGLAPQPCRQTADTGSVCQVGLRASSHTGPETPPTDKAWSTSPSTQCTPQDDATDNRAKESGVGNSAPDHLHSPDGTITVLPIALANLHLDDD